MTRGEAPGAHPFDAATAVEAIAAEGATTRLRCRLDEGWWVQRGPNGGYVAALMLRAMEAVAGERPPRSLTVQYPQAPVAGEAEIEVTVIRSGRSVSFLSARLIQGEATAITALGVFGDRRETEIEYTGAAGRLPAEAGDPGELFLPDPEVRAVPPVVMNFEVRLALGEVPLSSAEGEAVTGSWVRPHPARLVDAALATAILDVWIPAPFVKLDKPRPAPTLDFTVHFRHELPLPGAAPDDPYLIQVHSDLSRNGYFEEDAALWHPDGTLIAHSRQLALI